MLRTFALWFSLFLACAFAVDVEAGGSGLNVVVIVNQNSTNSVQLGNYYRLMRNVPPQNFLRINWPGTNTEWSLNDFTNTLYNPFLAMISSRQLTNQIDYVVLSMDIPYRITNGTSEPNSTTAAFFYGFKVDNNPPCSVASGSTSAYAASESIFRQTPPISGLSNFYMVTMITAADLPTAEMVVRQGAISDGTFPTQTVWLGKTPDTARNVRFTEFDNTIFSTRLRGNYSVMRTNLGNINGAFIDFPSLILGYEGGSYSFGTFPIPLVPPGAMADNLTSFGGDIFEDTTGQTTLLGFINSGVSGSYGTITEPCAYLQKFPDTQTYFYQSRGFSIGECYYQSLTNPYQGSIVAEPLAAPFAQTGAGSWTALASNAVLSGRTNLSGSFIASDAQHPLQQVDLFLDGNWLQTVTNIPPRSGDVLKINLNGYATGVTVPANATIKSVASNVNTTLNSTIALVNTGVGPSLHGDRVELQSGNGVAKTGPQIPLIVSSTNSSAQPTTFINAASAAPINFLDSIAQGVRSYTMTGSLQTNSTLTLTVTKTNNAVVTVGITNSGFINFTDFAQEMVNAIGATPGLQGLDGLFGDNVEVGVANSAVFNLVAQGQGFAAAQIKASFTASAGIVVTPSSANTLTQNLTDLEPRQHLYITAGVSNLNFSASFVTTNYPDGYHELIAVAYEGSSVHTQTRATQEIIIKNSSLSATLTPIISGSNSTLQPALQINVTANTNNISSIQLFSTGGLLASATNQNSATFFITLSNLDVGVHPFYAIVTQSNAQQYHTQTQNIGLIGVTYQDATLMGIDYPFPVQATMPPPMLVWPATAGRSYTILSTTNLLTPFQPRATVMPTNSLAQWTETNTLPAQQFYRISASP